MSVQTSATAEIEVLLDPGEYALARMGRPFLTPDPPPDADFEWAERLHCREARDGVPTGRWIVFEVSRVLDPAGFRFLLKFPPAAEGFKRIEETEGSEDG